MQVPAPKIDLSIQLGEDGGQPTLARVVARNHTGLQQVNYVKSKAKLNEETPNYLVFLLRYSVYPGREAEALQYMEEGFNQTKAKDLMSPLQFITRKHKSEDECESSIYIQQGAVCVKYKFKMEEEGLAFLSNFPKFSKLQTQLILKGNVSHTMKNRTNVKVDYSCLHFTGEEIDFQLLHGILQSQEELIPVEVASNPFYLTLKKARKLHLSLKFKHFRQIKRYYDDIAKKLESWNFTNKSQKEDFKYQAPGLFREHVEGYAFLNDDLAVSADIQHQGEDIFLRLIKVYFKAAKKAFDL